MAHWLMRCPVCDRPRSFHWVCLRSALVWTAYGQFDAPADPDAVRHMARQCYLCGQAKTEHAEHLVARSAGGRETWSNVGGACARCNITKGVRSVRLTAEQQQRWDQQQARFRAAWRRVNPEAVSAELARLFMIRRESFGEVTEDELIAALTEFIEYNITGGEVPFEVVSVDGVMVLAFESGNAMAVHL